MVCPSIVAVGTMTSVARRTSSLASSGAIPGLASAGEGVSGTPPAEPLAEVIVGAKVGANDPAAVTGGGGLADWSRS